MNQPHPFDADRSRLHGHAHTPHKRYQITPAEHEAWQSDPSMSYAALGAKYGFDPLTVKRHANTGPLVLFAIPK